MMQDSSRTTSYIYDGDTSVKLSLWGGDYYWEFINDPTASIPAVLVSKGHADLETTYVYYVREPGGELLASFDSAETPNTLYYHFDDLGSTVLTTDGSGGDLGHSTYRAWGWPTTSDPGPYLFCGRLGYYEHIQDQNWLEQSSLLQLGVRFYDRDIGRFTQRDPVRDELASTYGYVDDRPVASVGPSGRTARDAWDATGGNADASTTPLVSYYPIAGAKACEAKSGDANATECNAIWMEYCHKTYCPTICGTDTKCLVECGHACQRWSKSCEERCASGGCRDWEAVPWMNYCWMYYLYEYDKKHWPYPPTRPPGIPPGGINPPP